MGIVIDFPAGQRGLQATSRPDMRGEAEVVILPVVRVEREPDAPPFDADSGMGSGRKRRRRVRS